MKARQSEGENMEQSAGITLAAVDFLNQAREIELLKITQYMVNYYELEDQGYNALAKFFKKTSITQMKHAEELAERILFLEGVVSTNLAEHELKKKLDVAAAIKNAIRLEEKAIALYNQLAAKSAEAADEVSSQLFEDLTADEELHLDEFQNHERLINELGNSYLASLAD